MALITASYYTRKRALVHACLCICEGALDTMTGEVGTLRIGGGIAHLTVEKPLKSKWNRHYLRNTVFSGV